MSAPTEPGGPASSALRRGTKNRRILELFTKGYTLNRFDGVDAGDTCLNSTVSTLANRFGLEFTRKPETVRNRFGTATRVTRYALAPSSELRARQLLGWLDPAGH